MVLMIALVQQKKKNIINFSKAGANICLNWHPNDDESYFFVTKIEIRKFKAKGNIKVIKRL